MLEVHTLICSTYLINAVLLSKSSLVQTKVNNHLELAFI